MTALALLPLVSIQLDGTTLPPEVHAALTTVVVRQALSLPAACELTWMDPSRAWSDPAPGTTLRVRVDGADLFTGTVVEVTRQRGPGPQVRVRIVALDALQALRRRWSRRAFRSATAAAIIAEIAAPLGVSIVGADGPRWRHALQTGQDDLAFLTLVAEQAGLLFVLRDGRLHLLNAEATAGDGPTLDADDLLEFTSTRAAASAGVQAAGWDAGRAEAVTGGNGSELLSDLALGDAAQADGRAAGVAERRTTQAWHISGTAPGDVRITAGLALGLRQGSDVSRHRLAAVTHHLDAERGHLTTFTSANAPIPAFCADRPLVTLGTVTAVDDPDGAGRVQVSLPACGGIDGGWVAAPQMGAGANKGLMTVPDVGDRVAVLYADALRSQGVVLGSLWGAGGPPDAGVAGGRVKRFTLRTAGGHTLVLDDAGSELALTSSHGHHLTFASGAATLHAAGSLTLEAPGKTVTIKASAIDLKSG
jgi:phage baseplate assembly protein gpV/phage protein D